MKQFDLLPITTSVAILSLAVSLACCGCGANSSAPKPDIRANEKSEGAGTTSGTATASSPASRQQAEFEPLIQPKLVDVASEVGIYFSFFSGTVPDRFFLPEVMGGGAVWADFNCDEILDLYLMNGSRVGGSQSSNSKPTNHLYLGSATGTFRNSSAVSGTDDAGYGQGCAAGDFNADGFVDLYLGNYGANILLLNNGDGTFTDVSRVAGVDDSSWTSSVIWLDVDGDSDLDLYVTNYLNVTPENIKNCDYDGQPGYCGPGQYDSVPDRVYLNDSQGAFTEGGEQLGLKGENGKGLAIVAADFDGDQQAEIYVANDMTSNFLFTRIKSTEGSSEPDAVRYEDVAVNSGCAQSGEGMNEASMGIACADFDGDSRNDLYLTHYYQMKNTLYRNLGGLMFDDTSFRLGAAGTSYEYLGFGIASLDYDRDGWNDLFITNGHVLGPKQKPHRMTGQLLHNSLNGRRFDDVSASAGPYFQKQWLGRGVASADYDSDGDLDLLVSHIDDQASLLRNDCEPGGCFLGFDLRTKSRIPAVGALVKISSEGLSQQRSLMVGGSYLCNHDQRILFGWIGTQTRVDVEVFWRSGNVDRHPNLDVNRYWSLEEGGGCR